MPRGGTAGWWTAPSLPTTGCLKKPESFALLFMGPCNALEQLLLHAYTAIFVHQTQGEPQAGCVFDLQLLRLRQRAIARNVQEGRSPQIAGRGAADTIRVVQLNVVSRGHFGLGFLTLPAPSVNFASSINRLSKNILNSV